MSPRQKRLPSGGRRSVSRAAKPRIAVRSDMEGLTGVATYRQVTPGTEEYRESREILMAELLALIEGLRAGGAGEIVIYDEHVQGLNTDLRRVPDGVRVIGGKPPYRPDWAGGLDRDCAGLVLLGLHARAGTPGALLAHTYEHDIRNLTLNGELHGEIAVETAIAGDCGVPLWLVVADSAGGSEARALCPGVATVSTKQSRAADGGVFRPLGEVCREIRAVAEQVVRRPPDVAPWRPTGPVRLELELNPGPYREACRELHAARFVGPDRIRLTGPDTTAVWAEYWQLKLAAQAAVAAAAGKG